MMHVKQAQGLTLIELLIAMAIFAVMSAAMFIAFDSFQKGKDVTEASAERLKRYQIAFNILSRDMQQMMPRPVRDEFGSATPLYAMRSEVGSDIEFTRAGWNRSPFSKVKRAELQRVSYYLEEKKLMRGAWRVLDRAEDSVPDRTELLDGIESLSFVFYYLDKQSAMQSTDVWPPDSMMLGQSGGATPSSVPDREFLVLPKIVEMKLDTEDMGVISRKFLVANCYVDAYHPTTGSAPLGGGCGS